MTITRRQLLGQAGALSALGLMPGLARAEIALGTARLTTLSDGFLSLPANMMFEPLDAQALAPILERYDISGERLTPPCNLTLYQDGINTVLFDVGAGPDFMPSAGMILDSLDALGLGAEDITHVVFTHAHPDHIWGLLDGFDDLTFFEATYMMGQAEWDYWWNPETVDTIGDARAAFAVGAKRRMERIADQVVLVGPDQEVLPGIASVALPGHTPGHMGFELRQGSQAALVVGDAIANHHVAFHEPQWLSGGDQDQALAAQTRAKLMDRLTAEDLMLVGFHLPQGGIGRVRREGQGYRFVPG
ncbi:MAG: MBL fold metallo-hydrolase [Pseudomonadota bacterium]